MKHFMKGFTLVELLIGITLFSLILTLVGLSLQVSQKTLQTVHHQVPLEARLQNAMDKATRVIRQASSVSGGGSSVTLLTDGVPHTLEFSVHSLNLDGVPLQENLQSANFQIMNGALTNYVTITLSAAQSDSLGTNYMKQLIASASLRDISPGIVSSQTQNPTSSSSPTTTQSNTSSSNTSTTVGVSKPPCQETGEHCGSGGLRWP